MQEGRLSAAALSSSTGPGRAEDVLALTGMVDLPTVGLRDIRGSPDSGCRPYP
jgi:hypothetical protein